MCIIYSTYQRHVELMWLKLGLLQKRTEEGDVDIVEDYGYALRSQHRTRSNRYYFFFCARD